MRSLTKREINKVLLWSNSYTRFADFLSISDQCRGKNYWYALREAYTDSDNLFLYRDQVKQSFMKDEPYKEYIMGKAERDYLAKLPDIITIHRGMTVEEFKSQDFGVAWSLKRSVAEFFAYKYQRNHDTNHLLKATCELTIEKSQVIAYFKGRREYEIIYLHKPPQNKVAI